MQIIKYSEHENIDEAMKKDEPLLALISFDEEVAIVSHIDEAVEHHILLSKAGYNSADIDFFRIIFAKEGADWTFICPPDYKEISDKTRRIAEFYKDGIRAISHFPAEMGYFVDINIPRRYRLHFDMMGE